MKKVSDDFLFSIVEGVLKDLDLNAPRTAPVELSEIVIDRIDSYDATKVSCWSFRKKGDMRKGVELNLGNMVIGFPFEMLGRRFNDSECAYIAGCYSNFDVASQQIQAELSAYKLGGYNAKMAYRKTKNDKTMHVRKDWELINFQWMLLVIAHKCQSNREFANLLKCIPADAHLIEDTTYHTSPSSIIWGAKNQELKALRKERNLMLTDMLLQYGVQTKKAHDRAQQLLENQIHNVGVWTGKNATGKALKICQLCLLNGTSPPIDWELLNSKELYWFGERLTFSEEMLHYSN